MLEPPGLSGTIVSFAGGWCGVGARRRGDSRVCFGMRMMVVSAVTLIRRWGGIGAQS